MFAVWVELVIIEVVEEEEFVMTGPLVIEAIARVLSATIKVLKDKVIGEVEVLAMASLLAI